MKKKRRKLRVFPVAVLTLFTLFLTVIAIILIVNSIEKPLPTGFEDIIDEVAYSEGIAEHILYAVIFVESSFDKDVVSSAGAVGLMQLLPDTAKWLCEREGVEYSDEMLTDAEFNIRYGAKYLMILYDRYQNWDAAHAAYHAGFTRVDNWLKEGTATYNEGGQLIGIPIESTEQYVNKIGATREKYFKQLKEEKK